MMPKYVHVFVKFKKGDVLFPARVLLTHRNHRTCIRESINLLPLNGKHFYFSSSLKQQKRILILPDAHDQERNKDERSKGLN